MRTYLLGPGLLIVNQSWNFAESIYSRVRICLYTASAKNHRAINFSKAAGRAALRCQMKGNIADGD